MICHDLVTSTKLPVLGATGRRLPEFTTECEGNVTLGVCDMSDRSCCMVRRRSAGVKLVLLES